MSQGEIRDDDVTAALQRLLAWPDIARSPQLARFLEHIVTLKLRGEAESIKAYSVAVDVFGRPADFDPQSDPIVRVQARRLRNLIEQYYREQGANETLRIELPTGRYVPEFVTADAADVVAEPIPDAQAGAGEVEEEDAAGRGDKAGGLSTSWFVLAVLSISALILAYGISSWYAQQEANPSIRPLDRPSVSVMEFQSLTGEAADQRLVAGLAVEIITDLQQFETVNPLYGSGPNVDVRSSADFGLSGIVRREAGGVQYSAILTEALTGTVVWSKEITVDDGDFVPSELINHVARKLSSALGSPRGPLHHRARELIESSSSVAAGESLYLCLMRFELYRERRTIISGEQALACFDGLGEVDRQSALTKAARVVLLLDTNVVPVDGEAFEERKTQADLLMAEAVAQAPTSAFVWQQRALAYILNGEYAKADAAYGAALQLNPSNTDAMASRARQLALNGQLDVATDLARRALEDAPAPPPWYYGVPTFEALQQGDYARAAEYAAIYAEADRELGSILAVIVGQRLGDSGMVNAYLPRVLDNAAFRSTGIIPRLAERIDNPAMMDQLREALLAAGIPPAALSQPF